MKRSARRGIVADRLHKGFVIACVAITLYGMSGLAARWYNYFAVLRPETKQRELLEKQQLLSEGSSDVLLDSAINLKS